MPKNSITLVGVAGEYYVCAELCRRNILALVTPKNNPLFDIMASDVHGNHSVAIQVKTTGLTNTSGWMMNAKLSIKKNNDKLFVVLVRMRKDGKTDFYIFKHDELVDRVNKSFEAYYSRTNKDGSLRKKDENRRWLDFSELTDDDKSNMNNWSLLGFPTESLPL